MGSITVVGLGPGAFGLITLESWEKMRQAGVLLLRTEKHPTVEEIRRRGVTFQSYDSFYENAEDFVSLYSAIAKDLWQRASSGENIVYAVPGSPLVAERTVVLLRELAAKTPTAELTILPGMSFLEVFYVRLGIDPIDGVTIVDAEDFSELPMDLRTGIVITQVYNEQIASDTKLSLMEAFPDDYKVFFVHNLGLPDEDIHPISLFELDRQKNIDHLTSLYVPPRPAQKIFDFTPLVDIMQTLRSPGGCPWDLKQSHKSLRKHLIEEVYEVLEAIDLEDPELLCEELGDLLLQIVFHARIAEESGMFSMQDVIAGITEKLIRRHPHIFGDVQASDAAAVLVNWEAIKQKEKPERVSVLDGVPAGLPALMTAEKLQRKAAKVGFDWKELVPLWEKIAEETGEFQEAIAEKDADHMLEELGDVLFVWVNMARHMGLDPEMALRGTNRKFIRRFSFVEGAVKKAGIPWESVCLEQLDAFWEQAKEAEKHR